MSVIRTTRLQMLIEVPECAVMRLILLDCRCSVITESVVIKLLELICRGRIDTRVCDF
jgi:hypothetical protein